MWLILIIVALIGVVAGMALERVIQMIERELHQRARRENMKYAENVIREARETAASTSEAADGQRFADDVLKVSERGRGDRQ